jgi:hypothetical protein
MTATIIDGAARFREARRLKDAIKRFEDTVLCFRAGMGSFTKADVWAAFDALRIEYHNRSKQR